MLQPHQNIFHPVAIYSEKCKVNNIKFGLASLAKVKCIILLLITFIFFTNKTKVKCIILLLLTFIFVTNKATKLKKQHGSVQFTLIVAVCCSVVGEVVAKCYCLLV